MTNLLLGFHPSFESLSAYTDLSDVDRAASRLTRHIARCPDCQATVRELRAMGESARLEPTADVPPELWTRIQSAASAPHTVTETTAELSSSVWNAAPALKPTSNWPVPGRRLTARQWTVGALAAAAAIAGVVMLPGSPPLEAAGTSRLTFSPSRPAPGGLVKVRYVAAPWLRGQPRLVLVGRWLGDSVRARVGTSGGDSLATLRPVAGGSYEATFRLPASAPGAWLGVSDSTATETDIDGSRPWVLIAGTSDGKPSLTALLAAVAVPAFYGSSQLRPRQNVDASDSLRRYFPNMPAGWAYARPKQGKGTLFERLFSYFQSSERKYLSFYNDLWPRKTLDAERLHEMVVFGLNIAEPAEANRWARRLALEHPEDPRALDDLATALHALELTQPAGLRDSMQRWLPVLDKLYQHGGSPTDRYVLIPLVSRYADSGTVERWRTRIDSTWRDEYWIPDMETNAAHRQRAEGVWLRNAQRSCDRLPGQFPFLSSSNELSSCQRGRIFAFTLLARAKLLDGDPRAALAFTDSADKIPFTLAPCGRYWGSALVEIPASLRIGDTARAERAAAMRVGVWSNGPVADSVNRWLGPRARTPRFKAAVDSAHRGYVACTTREKAEREARMNRYRGAN